MNILFIIGIIIILLLNINYSSFGKNNIIINFCSFYTEGPPNDEGKNFSDLVPEILKGASGHFNKITFYTPKKLKDFGYEKYLKKYKLTDIIRQFSPVENVGLSSFRAAMFLHSLKEMNDGDILFHRDINYKKYPNYTNFDNAENQILKILDECQFDFFVPFHDPHDNFFRENLYNKKTCKGNVIRELGENHKFSYEFPQVHLYMFIMRKSKITIELLTEWQQAMENPEWLNGENYGGDTNTNLTFHTIDQCILSVIIANWIRKGKYNIPKKYPFIYFSGRSLQDIGYFHNYDYLKYLDKY
jgi:hypothetical protein